MSKLPIRVRSVLGCDDIREEANGKYIAIGLFGPSLTLIPEYATDHGETDRSFSAHFLMSIDVIATGDHAIQFRLERGSGGGGIAKMTVAFEAKGENVPFPLGPMTLRVPEEENELILSIKDGDAWKRIARWSIETARSDQKDMK